MRNLQNVIKIPTILLSLLLCGMILGCSERKHAPKNKPVPLLLISFDGFRYDYTNRVDTPNFDSLAKDGVKAERLIPIFPTKTFPNHYTIATGLYPEHSGIIGNNMYDPKWNKWYHINNRKAVENGRWYNGEPIWNTVEKQGLTAGTLFWVGSEADIQHIHPSYWKPYDESMPYKARIDTVIKWLSYPADRAADFATLYFEQVDSKAHRYGVKSDSMAQAIRQADELMGYLKAQLKKKGLWNHINIIVVSDHGMVDLSAKKIIRLDKIIYPNNIKRIIWSPATMIWPKKGKKEEMYQALKKNEHHYKIYKKEHLPDRYHLKNNRRVADLVMVADLGYTILNKTYQQKFLASLPGAAHGYDNHRKKMQGIFYAYGPAFQENILIHPFQNIHIYDLMNALMNTEPAKNDGSLDSLSAILK